jgi:hypothetical protein
MNSHLQQRIEYAILILRFKLEWTNNLVAMQAPPP